MQDLRWKRDMWTLYAVRMLIVVRSLFRFIEFAEGSGGSIYKKEALMYVFDASLLFLTTVCFATVYPGRLFKTIARAGMAPSSEDDFVPLHRYRR